MPKKFAAEFRVWVTVRLEAESEGEARKKLAALSGDEIEIDGDIGEGLDLSPVATIESHDFAQRLSVWEE